MLNFNVATPVSTYAIANTSTNAFAQNCLVGNVKAKKYDFFKSI